MRLCECGCGQEPALATRTRESLGLVKGEPVRFVQGHATRGKRQPLHERLFAHSELAPDGCRVWTGYRTPDGYGRMTVNGATQGAHRVAYELFVGAIPKGLVIDHLCRNRACVNPLHLEVVTNRENILRGEGHAAQNARKTHCIRGHDLTDPKNTYTWGTRECRLCARLRAAEWQAAGA